MLKKIFREIARPIRRFFFKKLQQRFDSGNIKYLEKWTNFLSQHDQKISTFPIKWLDNLTNNQLKLLSISSSDSSSIAPKKFQSNEEKFEFINTPPIIYYRFNNAIINIDSSSFIYQENAIIENVSSVEQTSCNYASGFFVQHNLSYGLFSLNIAKGTIDKGIFLGGNGSWNYYHWMIEILPKIKYISYLSDEYDTYPFILSEEVVKIPSFLESLNLLDPHRPRIFLKRKLSYHIDNLLYLSAINNLVFNVKEGTKLTPMHSFFRTDSILSLRSQFLNYANIHIDNDQKYPNKIFLARKNNHRQYNQDEIYESIKSYGFNKIFMEDYSLAEQIYLFNQATHILGPTGAAWTNIIFCNAKVKCLCWMATEIGDFSAFSTLANICKVNLEYITYQSNTHQIHADYYIKPHLLKEWLRQEFQ